ncbi:MAG TPA: polysaccharide deacetylase family protein [Gaiellaceae bacterium]|nr:polysaccharide deacetylase family protein [Gaiellaceae bacterium]
MRRAALVAAALALVLALAACTAAFALRLEESAAAGGSTPSEQPQTREQARPLAGPHNRPVPILMYHEIGPTPPGAALPDLYLSRADFASQLRWLASHGYHPVTLRAAYLYWAGLRPLPNRPIVLTFDDGYRGHFSNAAPLLRSRGWPGVLNLEYAHLVHQDLTGPMIRKLLADGWELASHTLTHPDLTAVDDATLRREVGRSRQLLRRRFGVRVDFFCYPAGRYDARVVEAVRAAGHLGATTTAPGLAGPKHLFTLKRIRVNSGDDARKLAEKLAAVNGVWAAS